LLGGRLRTVLSRLEFLASGRHYALTSTDWMPHAVPWLGFPSWCGVGQTGRGRYGPSFGDTRGGSCPIRWCGPSAWVPSSESLSKSASSDRHRGRVVAGESAGWMLALERIEPALSSPFRGVSGVNGDDRDPDVGSQLAEAIPQLGGGQAGYVAAEGLAPLAPRGAVATMLSALDARCDEVEVLDGHRRSGHRRSSGTVDGRTRRAREGQLGPQRERSLWIGLPITAGRAQASLFSYATVRRPVGVR